MKRYFDRELSWLSFNYRVLQEAINEHEPLMERLKFLAIYSSNLDEFYRVRVASLKHILKIQKEQGLEQDASIKKVLKKIKKTVHLQQIEFTAIFSERIIPQLEEQNIFLVHQKQINEQQHFFLEQFFKKEIEQFLEFKELSDENDIFFKNKGLYLVIEVNRKDTQKKEYFFVNVPVKKNQKVH